MPALISSTTRTTLSAKTTSGQARGPRRSPWAARRQDPWARPRPRRPSCSRPRRSSRGDPGRRVRRTPQLRHTGAAVTRFLRARSRALVPCSSPSRAPATAPSTARHRPHSFSWRFVLTRHRHFYEMTFPVVAVRWLTPTIH